VKTFINYVYSVHTGVSFYAMAADYMQLFHYCTPWCLNSHNELLVGANGYYYKKLSKVPLTTALYYIYITNVWEISLTRAGWILRLCVMN